MASRLETMVVRECEDDIGKSIDRVKNLALEESMEIACDFAGPLDIATEIQDYILEAIIDGINPDNIEESDND